MSVKNSHCLGYAPADTRGELYRLCRDEVSGRRMRQQIQEANYTAYAVMKFLAVMGILACVFDDSMLLPAIIFGVGTAIGIYNWRNR
jgi:hypothetical protein